MMRSAAMDAINVVCFARDHSHGAMIECIADVIRGLNHVYPRNTMRCEAISASQDMQLSDHETLDGIIAWLKHVEWTNGKLRISNRRIGEFIHKYNIEWQIDIGYQPNASLPDVCGSWLAPRDAFWSLQMRYSGYWGQRTTDWAIEMCKTVLERVAKAMNVYFGFVSCENLEDTNGGDLYHRAIALQSTNVRRAEWAYWASLHESERRCKVPAVMWGNYYDGELLGAVRVKCPDFFTNIKQWKLPPILSSGPLRDSPHVVIPCGSGIFYTLTESPVHDSRSDMGIARSRDGRLITLRTFARRQLAAAQVHI